MKPYGACQLCGAPGTEWLGPDGWFGYFCRGKHAKHYRRVAK